jgi:transcriptional regulator NrdR family protein
MSTKTNTIDVIKRDGTKESFDVEKIGRVVQAAGLTTDQGITLAKAVASLIQGKKVDEVTSLEIRNLVYEELKKVNTYAADLFAWYEKTKDK